MTSWFHKRLLACLCCSWATLACADRPPNIVFILADDLGYGDLSSYGATDINTPNIDRLAKEGMRFTDYYAAANTCSPSRAALMTGRYPPRTGVNAVLSYDTVEGLPLDEITIAELLRDAGYTTAMIGKWHLAQVEALMPWHQGFGSFFGSATSNDDNNFFLYEASGTQYRRIPEKVEQTQLITQYTQHAIAFLQQEAQQAAQEQTKTGKPFFLYLAHNAPHVPLHPDATFVGSSKRGIYGDVVQELDASVGQVLDTLKQLQLDDNTLVIFTSDNGGWRTMRDWGGSNGVLREGKLTTFDGGHRVPALVRWPHHVPAGVVNHDIATMMDWFPTVAHLSSATVPKDRVIDGRDITAVLEGAGKREQTPYFYFGLRPPIEKQDYVLAGVREGQWKYKAAQRGYYPQFLEPLMKVGLYHHGEMLFDLDSDPGEQRNVIDAHPDIARHLQQLMRDFRNNNTMRPAVNVNAAQADNASWQKLWLGIAEAAILVVVMLLVVLWLVWRGIKRLLRR
jgi:arylsulfatase A-like enzyme